MTKQPTMFDTVVKLDGIKIEVDPIDRPRSDDSDNVMAIFAEEQPLTWKFAKPYLITAKTEPSYEIDFLDVGCGSGIFGILAAKHLEMKVLAIDKSSRAVTFTKNNASQNEVFIEVRQEYYSRSTCTPKSVRAIGLYPPYHIYPVEQTEHIPQHARGGSDGQAEFKNQLKIAGHHIAPHGIIFFNMMCLGDQNGPAYLNYIPTLVDRQVSIHYANVFPPMDTQYFLKRVYGGRFHDFKCQTAASFPLLYYTVGIIRTDNKHELKEVRLDAQWLKRTWEDRIELHRQIAKHAVSDL